jgi:adenylylsulfate kinase-like enzyme
MIYWFTGQPGHGKTVLAKKLKDYFENISSSKVFHVDGDDLREILSNKDYSKVGRENNIKTAYSIAKYLNNQGYDSVVSLVSPYRSIREEFKKLGTFCEIYIHTTEIRGREQYHVLDYESPIESFIDIDTTNKTEDESFNELLNHLNNINYEKNVG